MEQLGALAALGAALLWTCNSVVVERRGIGLDSGGVNFARLLLGLALVSLSAWALQGAPLPQATAAAWAWLLLSGLIGFSLGDTLIFGAFQAVGARLTMLVFSFAPVLTAVLSFLFFGERLTALNVLGMALVLSGILMVIGTGDRKRGRRMARGLLFAATASLTQALANVTSKLALTQVSALYATQIRLLGGVVGMLLVFALGRRWGRLREVLLSPRGRTVTVSGAVLGTLLGVLLSMVALKLTKAAIASTLSATMPVLILPFSHFLFREKLRARDLLGAVLSVAGLAVLFL